LHPARLRSLVIGRDGAGFCSVWGRVLKGWVEAPDLERYRDADPRQIVADALSGIGRYEPSDHVCEDYLSSYLGARFVESMRYVRSYPDRAPGPP
jgi:hypothetical protein